MRRFLDNLAGTLVVVGFASLALGWALAWFLGAGPGSMVSMCGVIWGVIGTMGLAIKKDDDDRYAGGWAP